MALSKEQKIVARNTYGPRGEEVVVFLDKMSNRKELEAMEALASLNGLFEGRREDVLNLITKYNRVREMNNAVEDLTGIVYEMMEPTKDTERTQILLDTLVYIVEAMIICDHLEEAD